MSFEPESLRFNKADITNFDTFKGLIVTDFHLGKFNELENEEIKLISNLKELVKTVDPSHLFILGDLIHHSDGVNDQNYYDFFEKLENNFSLPIYIIPGNHDRHPSLNDCFNRYRSSKQLMCIDTEFLEIKFNENFSVFLVHDAKYDSDVYGMLPLADWMNKIRNWKCCKKMIKSNDVLIFGHTHANFDDEENKNHAIGPFSVSLKGSSYAVISFSDKFNFQHFHNFFPTENV